MAVIGMRFGDEYSTLLDEFERQTFEDHMNRPMLERSFSEPSRVKSSSSSSLLISVAPIPLVTQAMMQGPSRRGRGPLVFRKVLKKLLRPILGRKRRGRKQVPDANNDLLFCRDFSKSLRF